jgi:hypothetical protein
MSPPNAAAGFHAHAAGCWTGVLAVGPAPCACPASTLLKVSWVNAVGDSAGGVTWAGITPTGCAMQACAVTGTAIGAATGVAASAATPAVASCSATASAIRVALQEHTEDYYKRIYTESSFSREQARAYKRALQEYTGHMQHCVHKCETRRIFPESVDYQCPTLIDHLIRRQHHTRAERLTSQLRCHKSQIVVKKGFGDSTYFK